MKPRFIYLYLALGIMMLGSIEGNAAQPAKKSSSKSTSGTSYVNCNYSDLKFEKTSTGYISPVGHTYLAVENETSIELVFNSNNTCTIYYVDNGNESKQTVRCPQSKNAITLTGFSTCTIVDEGRQLKSSDGLTFIVTE